MAGEIQATAPTGRTVYALIRTTTGTIWNGSSFGAYSTPAYSTYVVTMTEQGSASGFYVGTFPSTIVAGSYTVVAKVQAGGSPAETDTNCGTGTIEWTGSAVASLADTATSGQVGQFAPIRLARGVAVSGFPFYLKSSADHVTPFTSGVVSGQINRDGTGWTVLQSGILSTAYTEMGNGFFRCNLTSGDTNCDVAALLFTATQISGYPAADPLPISLVLQRTSGH